MRSTRALSRVQPFFRRSEEPALSGAEGISRYDAVCHGRSLGPLDKTRSFGMTQRLQGAPLFV